MNTLTPASADALLPLYPEWVQELARRYFTKTTNQFILHGNVRDLIPLPEPDGFRYVPLRDFLRDDLFAPRDLVLFYDRSTGLQFANPATREDFFRALEGFDQLYGSSYARQLPRDPVRVFTLLERYFRLRLAEGRRIACIIDYAETIVPATEGAFASSEDRDALVFLLKWSHDPLLLQSDFTLCLTTENLTDLHRQLVQNPYTAALRLPLPDEKVRQSFIESYLGSQTKAFLERSELSPAVLAHHTAGLNLIQLRTILADVLENHTLLSFERLVALKKAFIEAEAYGLLEFIETKYTLDMVAGHHRAKAHLRAAAQALRQGRYEVLPMGYLVTGPVGTGKTFLITCFAGEIGIPMVRLKNFRSQWQGVTEGNLEKILTLLEAMTPVAVMIDEADAALGHREAEGDSGVSKRVFAQIASFMSNPAHRGRILFFLLTARPDLMPVDLKRQGRAEEHLALFYPSSQQERDELLEVMLRRTGIPLSLEEVPSALRKGERAFSGAELEALLTRAKFRAAAQGLEKVTPQILQEVVDDFLPPTYPLEIELQTLVAALECTSRELLPEPLQNMDREAMLARVEALKQFLAIR